jgi:hypothetical protein
MRIADEYMDVAEIFFDFLAFQNTCVGHRDLPQTRPMRCLSEHSVAPA